MISQEVVKYQTKVLLQSKYAIAVWLMLIITVSANFIMNCIHNVKIHYVTEMFDPLKMITLSGWSDFGIVLMYIYPLIVVLPTAMSYYDDRLSGINYFLQSRCGFKKYYYSNAIAVCFATFILFTIPFLIELILSTICFSFFSKGDPSGFPYYETIPDLNKYLFYKIYLISPFLYGLVMIIRFGLISCLFSLFNYSFAVSPKIKYKMITMIPLLVLLYALMFIDKVVPLKLTYIEVIPIFNYKSNGGYFYIIGCLAMFWVAILELKINEKRYYIFKK